MIKNFRALDGYALNVTDGYGFTTEWFDLVNCTNLSVSIVFVGGSPQGTASIQISNDVPDLINKTSPRSAGGPYGTALDQTTLSGSSTAITTSGTTLLTTTSAGFRFAAVTFVASSNVNSSVSVFVCAKTTNG